MNRLEQRSVDAAKRLLQVQEESPYIKLVVKELAGWILGRFDQRLPVQSNAIDDHHIHLSAAAGASEFQLIEQLLNDFLATEKGDKLLFSACDFAGDFMAEQLIEIAARHPENMFNGRMLANTSNPLRLLELLCDHSLIESNAIETVGELVLVGLDSHEPLVRVEQRWEEVMIEYPSNLRMFRDVLLRITVRKSMSDAISLLQDFANDWGAENLYDGVRAVLTRLVREDPARASKLVANCHSHWDQLAWLESLLWWFEVPKEAKPIIDDLVAIGDPEVDMALARLLTRTKTPELLGSVLESSDEFMPLERALDFAPGVYQLRAAGFMYEAEQVREQVLPFLPITSQSNDEVSAIDLFDVLSAPDIPPLVPWGAGPGSP